MKKVLYVVLMFVFVGIANSVAQTTIGSLDTPNATLDVRSLPGVTNSSDGIITPKLTGDELFAKASGTYGANQNGALVYVTAAASAGNQTGKTVNVKTPGYYYYDSASNVWIALARREAEWFFMPQWLIPTTKLPGNQTVNLFNAYSTSISGAIKSGGDDFSVVHPVKTANDYDYYVVCYDPTVFSNVSISPLGILNYTIIGKATDKTYINIIFVRRLTPY